MDVYIDTQIRKSSLSVLRLVHFTHFNIPYPFFKKKLKKGVNNQLSQEKNTEI